LMNFLGVRLGFTFSAGAFDWAAVEKSVVSTEQATGPISERTG
jgi:phosphotransferase system  glucose/maltose/N-acetylglucosamine-specific IIC component